MAVSGAAVRATGDMQQEPISSCVHVTGLFLIRVQTECRGGSGATPRRCLSVTGPVARFDAV